MNAFQKALLFAFACAATTYKYLHAQGAEYSVAGYHHKTGAMNNHMLGFEAGGKEVRRHMKCQDRCLRRSRPLDDGHESIPHGHLPHPPVAVRTLIADLRHEFRGEL